MRVRHFPKKLTHFFVTLRFSILSIFITLFIISMLSIISISYVRFSNNMTYFSLQLMNQLSTSVLNTITSEMREVETKSRVGAKLIEKNVADTRKHQEIEKYIFHLLQGESKKYSSVQSIVWGDEDGNVIVAEKQPNGSIQLETIYHLRGIIKAEITTHDSRDHVIKQTLFTEKNFDPRVRPWYLLAKKTGRTSWTDIFMYGLNNPGQGVAVATPVYKNKKLRGVLAVGIRLDYFQDFLSTLRVSPHGLIYVVSHDGRIIVFSKLKEYRIRLLDSVDTVSSLPWLAESFHHYQKNRLSPFIFKYDQKRYLAVYNPLPHFAAHHWLVGVIVPEDDFVGLLRKINWIVMGISLLILIIGIFIVSYLITRVVQPLKLLTQEAEKIKHFELEETPHIQSRIKEIFSLAHAMYAMKQGLRSFQKYVPASLVRQLIESGEDARTGGTKKHLAVFFSDIKNFTTLSEHADPKKLVEQICDYFEELSRIIAQHRGTIDKYIGDSIMAFWGAPLPEKQPCTQAAKTALSCIAHLKKLNQQWEAQGKFVLLTRIGIHTGNAIVGNIGSSERLNYTAIGDVINAASRLESVNKLYGSQILVSESVYKAIHSQFALRLIDCITLKGKADAHYIYELLAENSSELAFDLTTYSSYFTEGFSAYQQKKWDDAITSFTACLRIYPEDTVAPVFIQRCKNLKLTHPVDWDGIWHFTEK